MKAANVKFLTVVCVSFLTFIGTFAVLCQTPQLRYDPDSYIVKTIAGKVFIKRDNDDPFRIYSNNVRVAEPRFRRVTDEKLWEDRKYGVINAIKSNSNLATLIGLQETKHNQLKDVLHGLNRGHAHHPYTHYGVGRDDGKKKGEYAAIIYNTDEWKLLNGSYKWLSETPDKPSRSWGAGTNRIITFTTVEHKTSGKRINYLNTHLDNRSELARNKSAELIVNWIKEIPNDYPTFLSGDFNSLPSQGAYNIITTTLSDTNKIAYNKPNETDATCTGFKPGLKQQVIDFIFAPKYSNSNADQVTVTNHVVVSNEYKGFRFSDHRPIFSDFELEKDSD